MICPFVQSLKEQCYFLGLFKLWNHLGLLLRLCFYNHQQETCKITELKPGTVILSMDSFKSFPPPYKMTNDQNYLKSSYCYNKTILGWEGMKKKKNELIQIPPNHCITMVFDNFIWISPLILSLEFILYTVLVIDFNILKAMKTRHLHYVAGFISVFQTVPVFPLLFGRKWSFYIFWSSMCIFDSTPRCI